MAVSIVKCDTYNEEEVRQALINALAPLGGLSFVKAGMKIVIKANLVSFLKPEAAATTHPVMLTELTKLLCEKGAEVIVGDSPGGLYDKNFVGKVYSVTGMKEVEKVGGKLNFDFSTQNMGVAEKICHNVVLHILISLPPPCYLPDQGPFLFIFQVNISYIYPFWIILEFYGLKTPFYFC